MTKLKLPTVTLVAAASVNVEATLEALRACTDQISFGDRILFTDQLSRAKPDGVRVVPIPPMQSARAYSNLLLTDLVEHVRTNHCLVVQWDGFVLDADRWDPAFLEFDYIGAPWPQFDDGYTVGNGGFSLRSRKLLEACRSSEFKAGHPEDVSIGRVNRPMLEEQFAIRFADDLTAMRFSQERLTSDEPTFGFHGIFNMIPLLGQERFWTIYKMLDDRSTAAFDYRLLMRQLGNGRNSLGRRLRLTKDLLRSWSAERTAG